VVVLPSKILKPGMVVTVEGGDPAEGGGYCKSQDKLCNAYSPEKYRVLDAGDGYIAFHSGSAPYKGASPP